LPEDLKHFAGGSTMVAGNDFNLIAFGDMCFDSTAIHGETRRLEDFRCERDDLHEVLVTQFTRNWPEDPGAFGLTVVVDDDHRIAVETENRPIGATNGSLGPNDHRLCHVALFFTFAVGVLSRM